MCDGCPCQLIVTFDNGEKRRFDVKPYIKGSWYGNLKDPGYFSAVSVNGYTVEWPKGQDLCNAGTSQGSPKDGLSDSPSE